LEKAFGITPDISALIQFSFFEPIYYHDSTISFPSSRELPGRFLGLANSVGDALTRSVLRSALDLKNVNLRALPSDQAEDSLNNGTR